MVKGFTANRKGFAQLRKSAEIRNDLERRAEDISQATGDTEAFVTDSEVGKNRARASVRTYGVDAAVREQREHTLERSVEAGGGSA